MTITTFVIAYEVEHDGDIDVDELHDVVESYFENGTVRDGLELAAAGHADRSYTAWHDVAQYGAGILLTYDGESPGRAGIASELYRADD